MQFLDRDRRSIDDGSDCDPLDLIKVDLDDSTVVEAGGPRRLVAGHLLCDLELSTVAQVLGDACGAEAVATNARVDACCLGTPAHHPEHVD